jgi:hypothetical protein
LGQADGSQAADVPRSNRGRPSLKPGLTRGTVVLTARGLCLLARSGCRRGPRTEGIVMEGTPRKGVHFQYNIDLSDPTPDALEKIRNDLVEKITSNVAKELDELQGAEEAMSTHDRHYSIHSRD